MHTCVLKTHSRRIESVTSTGFFIALHRRQWGTQFYLIAGLLICIVID